MNQLRDPNAVLGQHEIEAIKVNQEIIKRMADNSQKIKNIFFILCAAIATLLKSDYIMKEPKTLLLFTFIVLVFWIMDAKYLQLERQFRKHHILIVQGAIGSLGMWKFDANKQPKDCLPKVMISFSLFLYPATLVVAYAAFLWLFTCA
jgi:hypothetical protein